jgi:hypothetical protein
MFLVPQNVHMQHHNENATLLSHVSAPVALTSRGESSTNRLPVASATNCQIVLLEALARKNLTGTNTL